MSNRISGGHHSPTLMLRRLGWLGAVALLGAALIIPGTVSAVAPKNALHQTPPISWNDPSFQGSASTCAAADLASGEVLWHFIHTLTGAGDLPSKLTATFDAAGTKTADGFQNGNSVVQYEVITGPDILLSASDSIVNDGNLNLSHICSNVTETTSSSTSTTESSTTSATSTVTTTSETGSVSDTTSTQDTTTTTSETGSVSDSTSTQSSTTAITTSESGGVSGETGTPGVTPPSTATTIGGSSGHSDGWRIILLALAGLAVLSLVLLPSDRKSKQR